MWQGQCHEPALDDQQAGFLQHARSNDEGTAANRPVKERIASVAAALARITDRTNRACPAAVSPGSRLDLS